MSLWKIAWRSIQHRGLASLLTTLSMALGVLLVVAVLSIHGVISQSFRNNSNLGYDMIVGAKGGKLQLTLNTVYYLSQPIENIPYDFYLEFLTAEERDRELRQANQAQELGRPGRYSQFSSLAIPLCLGDYFGRFRVIGTTTALLDALSFGPDGDRKFEFAEGRNFQQESKEDSYFEAVAGAVVAREMNVKLDDRITTTHGDPEGHGHGHGFRVVGILEPSGTPNDRVVFVNMEGFYLMEGHAKPEEHGETEAAERAHASGDRAGPPHGGPRDDADGRPQDQPKAHQDEAHQDEGHEHEGHEHGEVSPLPLEQREVTAILLRTTSPTAAPALQNAINEGPVGQAVMPVREIVNLFEIIVKPVQRVLLVLTAMVCVVSGVGILVSIYNSMSERSHEIAVMRALGAGRGTVMTVILLEAVLLAVGGGAIGWLLGHGLNWAAGPAIEQRTGVSIGFTDMAPPVNLLEILGGGSAAQWLSVSSELLLIPLLIVLAVAAGFLPAVYAYRTDVAKSLGK